MDMVAAANHESVLWRSAVDATGRKGYPMSLQLSITSGPDCGQLFQPRLGQSVLIGRDQTCHIRLTDSAVSRMHCRLELNPTQTVLTDLGSSWGTEVNGQRITRHLLRQGDRIRLGDTECVVLAESSDLETTMIPMAAIERESFTPPPVNRRRASRPPDVTRLVGETFVRFEVQELIVKSSSGVVYRAKDLRTSRLVALKVYWPELFVDDSAKARFLRSIRAMIPLRHPNLVKLFAAGRTRGVCFTASEFVDGESTAQLLQRIGIAGMLDWQTVWRMGIGLTEAIQFIHTHHIVHRNVTPANILLRKADGLVKLGDSMLAKALDLHGQPTITQPGEMVGEINYLAPEQITGTSAIDERADLYGLGATLYAVLTGRPPFLGGQSDVIGKILTEPPVSPTKIHLAIPAAFEGLVLRLLAKLPADRYENAASVLTELRRIRRIHGCR